MTTTIEPEISLTPIPATHVRVLGGPLARRLEINRSRTIHECFHQCEKSGRIANFARAGGLEEGPFQGIPYDDSDVFKMLEGASYILAAGPDPALEAMVDDAIAKIAAAQEADGYLYTARTLNSGHPLIGRTRWLNDMGDENGRDSHELYNLGHLYEAAVAHYGATGKRTLLDVALRSVDLVLRDFGPGRLAKAPGGPVIEMALVRLAAVTGRSELADLAKFFLDQRGHVRSRHSRFDDRYFLTHIPLVDQREATGHAVRAAYLYAAMADMGMRGEEDYAGAAMAIWDNIVTRKMSLTGGIGAKHGTEGFGGDFEIPRDSYNETCAAIGLAFFTWRMLLFRGEARYADVLERIIHNGMLSGVSLAGDRFFYPNPLVSDGETKFNSDLSCCRVEWFGTSCCPVNIVRFVPSIPGMIYAVRDDNVFVHLFAESAVHCEVDRRKVEIRQETNYPWGGRVTLTVHPVEPGEFSLRVRIPGWARGEAVPGRLYADVAPTPKATRLTLNGAPVEAVHENGYAIVWWNWRDGDRVEIEFPMMPRRVVADERVEDLRGLVAVEYGPLVYCAEEADNGPGVPDIILDDGQEIETVWREDLLGGVQTLSFASGVVAGGRATLVPYALWNNRGAGKMAVWLKRES